MAAIYVEQYLPRVLAQLVDAYRTCELYLWTYMLGTGEIGVYQYDSETWRVLHTRVQLGYTLKTYGNQLLFRSDNGPAVWNAHLNQITELPSAHRSYYDLDMLNDKIYICGGEDAKGMNIITTVQVYNAGTWDDVTTLSKLDHIATTGGDYLYVITTDMVTKRNIERFNVNTQTWSVLPDLDMEFGRIPNIGLVDDDLYVLIQVKRGSPDMVLLCYDEEDNEWINVSTLRNAPMVEHMTGSNNKLFVSGRDDQYNTVILMYDFDIEEWVNIPLPDLIRPEKVFSISMV